MLLLGSFMSSLDVAIVNVAAPTMAADLALTSGTLALAVSGYTVAYATLMVTGARLGDRHGHRNLFLGGLAAFTLASLACGLAPSGAALVVARFVQGASAAMMAPQVLTVVQLRLRDGARARAIALYATLISAGAVLGQILGGVLVSANLFGLSWRPIFLVNVPVGLVLLGWGLRAVPRTAGTGARGLDVTGQIALCAAVLTLVVPLIFGRELGGTGAAWVVPALYAVSVLLWTALVSHVRARRRRGGDPLIDPGLFRRPEVVLGLLSICASMVAYGGYMLVTTVHLQRDLGLIPLRSGLVLAPFAIGFAVSSLGIPRLPDRAGRVLPPLGVLLAAGAYAASGLLPRADPGAGVLGLVTLTVAGAGFGAGFSPVITQVVTGLPAARAPDASGVFNTVGQISYAVGVATVGNAFLGTPGADSFGTAMLATAAASLLAGVCLVALRWRLRGSATPGR